MVAIATSALCGGTAWPSPSSASHAAPGMSPRIATACGMRMRASTRPLPVPTMARSATRLGSIAAWGPRSRANSAERLASPLAMTASGPSVHDSPTK